MLCFNFLSCTISTVASSSVQRLLGLSWVTQSFIIDQVFQTLSVNLSKITVISAIKCLDMPGVQSSLVNFDLWIYSVRLLQVFLTKLTLKGTDNERPIAGKHICTGATTIHWTFSFWPVCINQFSRCSPIFSTPFIHALLSHFQPLLINFCLPFNCCCSLHAVAGLSSQNIIDCRLRRGYLNNLLLACFTFLQ